MNKLILISILFLSACGTVIPPSPIVNQNPVVVQPQPVPVPVPTTAYHIGEVVFVRNWYGMVCRGQIVNINYVGMYLLNPVICNNHLFYYNVVMPESALSR